MIEKNVRKIHLNQHQFDTSLVFLRVQNLA